MPARDFPYEFHLSARDLARVGVIAAHKGVWQGKPLVPAAWLEECWRPHTKFENGNGYGYLWWLPGGVRATGGYRPEGESYESALALGSGGQMLMVMPSADIVYVHISPRAVGRATKGDTPSEIGRRLAAARVGPARPDAPVTPLRAAPFSNPSPATPERTEMPLAPNARETAGDYEVSAGTVARVTFEADGLFIDMPGRGQAELFQEGPDRFFLKITDVALHVDRDAAGVVIGAHVFDGPRVIRLRKIR